MEKRQEALIAVNSKDPESWEYLICYEGNEDNKDEQVQGFIFADGRSDAYFKIKDIIDEIDIFASFIISEKSTLDKRLTIAQFMKYIVENNYVNDEDTEFDISDYLAGEDYDEIFN